jgi:hypothetical protein
MPVDPTVPDFHERVNEVKPGRIANEVFAEAGQTRATKQRSLWSAD